MGKYNGQPNEELQRTLTQAHKQAAYENDLILVNAGDVWVQAYRVVPGLSLYARDRIHANHAGAFLTASVFAATLFDLNFENLPMGGIIDNIPVLNLLTLASFALIILMAMYRFIKKHPLNLKNLLVFVIHLITLQSMSFFPHIFRFVEFGNRILLLYFITFTLLISIIHSLYHLFMIKLAKVESLKERNKFLFIIVVCCIVYVLTFIPSFDLRLYLYIGRNSIDLTQIVWSIFN